MDLDAYDAYRHNDATPFLFNVLDYFFSDKKHEYKHAVAKKHYDNAIRERHTYNATRVFKIMTGTTLVNKKIVTHQKIDNEWTYYIRTTYYQRVQRFIRSTKRNTTPQTPENKTPITTNPNITPYGVLQTETDDDTVSTKSAEPPPHAPKSTHTTPLPISSPAQPSNSQMIQQISSSPHTHLSSDNSDSVNKATVIQHVQQLEANLNQAVASLKDDNSDQSTNAALEDIHKKLFQTMVQPVITQLQTTEKQIHDFFAEQQTKFTAISERLFAKESTLDNAIKQYHTQTQRLEEILFSANNCEQEFKRNNDYLKTRTTVLKKKLEQLDQYEQRVTDVINKADTYLDSHVSKESQIEQLQQQVDRMLAFNTTSTSNPIPDTDDISIKTDKLISKVKHIKNNTRILAQQHEEEYDILNDRILKMEHMMNTIQKGNKPRINKKKHTPQFTSSSDSMSSTENASTSNVYSTPFRTQSAYYEPSHNTSPIVSKYGPNMDYLRKNVNITCTDTEQILDFYTKLRLAVEKGGIHIIPIEDITKSQSIARILPHQTKSDRQL